MSVQITHQGLASLVKALGLVIVEDTQDELNSPSGEPRLDRDESDRTDGLYNTETDEIHILAGQPIDTPWKQLTLCHEIFHWTGAAPRLARPRVAESRTKGVTQRERLHEELAAELFAVRLGHTLDIIDPVRCGVLQLQYVNNLFPPDLVMLRDMTGHPVQTDEILEVFQTCDAEAQKGVDFVLKTATATGFSQKIDRQAA